MNHRISLNKLNKTPAHRRAMIRNMLTALFRYERIKTTLAKAKALRRFAEKLITRAKVDGVHNRREAAKWVQDKAALNKLFTDIGPRFAKRPGGYTSIVKVGPRFGDASEMAYIRLVDQSLAAPAAKPAKKKAKSAASGDAATAPKASKSPVKASEKASEKAEKSAAAKKEPKAAEKISGKASAKTAPAASAE